MLKFKSFLASAAKLPALKNGEPVYLCIETYDKGSLVDKAIVTAKELTEYFGDSGYGINVTGYMTESEVKDLTLEQRGLPSVTPLVKPKTVPSPIWNDFNEGQKLWAIEHMKQHEEHRRKVAAAKAAAESIYAELERIYDDLAK